MSATAAVNVLLWTAAAAAAAWILIPAIAFSLNVGGLRTDIVPDAGPPTLYADDSVFGPRLSELAAIGFRMEGRTRERGRFSSPIQWTWESYEAQQWLVSSDGLTHATVYRLAEGEPARISVVTRFEDGGMVRTSCPGAGAKETTRPNYWRFDVRGVDAATLLEKHQEQVEVFARERGTKATAATVAEIAAADNAAEWPIVRKLSVSHYGLVILFLPAPLFLLSPISSPRGVVFAPISICLMAGFYALMRWWVFGPRRRQRAHLSHTRDLSEGSAPAPPDDIAEDGRILATGKNERRLRLLAGVAAALWCVWPILFVRAAVLSNGDLGAIVPGVLFFGLALWTAGRSVGRARGKMVWVQKEHRDPEDLWQSMLGLNFVFLLFASSVGRFHRLVIEVLVFVVALIAWTLEKKRGQ